MAGTGSATHDLAYNPGGVDCFLFGLSGRFDTDDWNDGVSIGYDPGILQFNETVVNGKGGWAACVHQAGRRLGELAGGAEGARMIVIMVASLAPVF